MNADVSYNDFIGSAAADISDSLNLLGGDTLESIGKYFKLDENRFEIFGLSIYGVSEFVISFLCVDKTNSTNEVKHFVTILYDLNSNFKIDWIFKRLNIVLHDRFNNEYSSVKSFEELRFSDCHT